MSLVLADHTFISAVPFLVPALVVIAVIGWHIHRERNAGDEDDVDYDEDWLDRPKGPPGP